MLSDEFWKAAGEFKTDANIEAETPIAAGSAAGVYYWGRDPKSLFVGLYSPNGRRVQEFDIPALLNRYSAESTRLRTRLTELQADLERYKVDGFKGLDESRALSDEIARLKARIVDLEQDVKDWTNHATLALREAAKLRLKIAELEGRVSDN